MSEPLYQRDTEQDQQEYSGGPTAMWLGIFALVCTTLGPCMCYTPFLGAIPLALAALSIGWQVTRDPNANPGAVQMAKGGMVAGGVAGLYLLLLGTLFALYIGIYVLMIFAVVGAGAVAPMPPPPPASPYGS